MVTRIDRIRAEVTDGWDIQPEDLRWLLDEVCLVKEPTSDVRTTVLNLHHFDYEERGVFRCAECIKYWPCPTAQALGVTE